MTDLDPLQEIRARNELRKKGRGTSTKRSAADVDAALAECAAKDETLQKNARIANAWREERDAALAECERLAERVKRFGTDRARAIEDRDAAVAKAAGLAVENGGLVSDLEKSIAAWMASRSELAEAVARADTAEARIVGLLEDIDRLENFDPSTFVLPLVESQGDTPK